MNKYENSNGLYRKAESPVKESVHQNEGLYTKRQSVVINNPTEEDINKAKKENSEVAGKKILKG